MSATDYQQQPGHTANRYRWYAIRPFARHRCRSIVETLESIGISYFRPYRVRLVKDKEADNHRQAHEVYRVGVKASFETSLIFFCCTDRMVRQKLQQPLYGLGMIYADTIDGAWTPSPIPHSQLVQFQRVLSLGCRYRILDDPADVFQRGQKVLVTDGKYKGFRGVIYRIQKHKHLIIRLQKGCAVMLEYVPNIFLRPLDDKAVVGDNAEVQVDVEAEDGDSLGCKVADAMFTVGYADFNHLMAQLAVQMRLLPPLDCPTTTAEKFRLALQAYEDVRTLRPRISSLDERLGFDLQADTDTDQPRELDSLVASLYSKLSIPFTPAHADLLRDAVTEQAAAAIHQLCRRLRNGADEDGTTTLKRDNTTTSL